MQKALNFLYPSHCVSCNAVVEDDSSGGLCGSCWQDTPFISGTCCDCCGVPLPGEGDDSPTDILCDECITVSRPWSRGRAAGVYGGQLRKLILGLKHSDRTDLAEPAGAWMARAAEPLIESHTIIAPVPLHWTRLLKRRYNQSALLGAALARAVDRPFCPDLLVRRHKTPMLEGKSPNERFALLENNVFIHPRRKIRIAGRPVLLVDDVLTTGATLAACAEACKAAGASDIHIAVLARVAKDA